MSGEQTWPFGGPVREGGLPEPAPEIIMAANGVYWRRYPTHLSMVPVSDDNDPTMTPFAVYRLVGWEDHDGTFHASDDARTADDPQAPDAARSQP